MTFVIITHVPHIIEQNNYFAYAPYVREMNIWSKYIGKLIIVAPVANFQKSAIDIKYDHTNIEFIAIEKFDLLNKKAIFYSILKMPLICLHIFQAMKKADHIHLRCPGNVGLLGSMMQILFPSKRKTAKYAGNWDPNSKQPWSYKLQRWILSNVFLTKNMQVLVYGEWENSSANIKSFFTATYVESEIIPFDNKNWLEKLDFVFVGTLVSGKNPLYAIKLVEALSRKGYEVRLKLFGEGTLRRDLENYICENNLDNFISIEGNQNLETVKSAYIGSHFVVLPSESEGWPKAIAEGMFWGCIPVASRVSCVPYMLDFGKRGILLEMNLEEDVQQIETVLKDKGKCSNLGRRASDWSRNYTLDVFDNEIKKLIRS